MKNEKLPLPGVAFSEQSSAEALPPLIGTYSGELTADVVAAALGAPQKAGRIKDVWLSVGASGKDDSNPLQVSGEVYINATTALSTIPSINHISGEASQQKTTKITGDTGITQAVINQSANSFSPGDVISYALTVDRTATPTTEISSVVLVVELEPLGIHRRS